MSEDQGAFARSVEEFVSASPWVGPEQAPAVAALRAMAASLDAGPIQAAMLSSFGQTYRALRKEKPTETRRDPLEEALDEAGAGTG